MHRRCWHDIEDLPCMMQFASFLPSTVHFPVTPFVAEYATRVVFCGPASDQHGMSDGPRKHLGRSVACGKRTRGFLVGASTITGKSSGQIVPSNVCHPVLLLPRNAQCFEKHRTLRKPTRMTRAPRQTRELADTCHPCTRRKTDSAITVAP